MKGKITISLSTSYPIALRALPEYPGRKLGIHFESGDSLTVFTQYRKCHHVHSDGVRYEIRFYELADGLGWIHDFDIKMPHQRTIIFSSSELEEDTDDVLVSNISTDPVFLYPMPEYPSDHLSVSLDPGECAYVSSEFRKVFYIHSDLVRYCIRFYRLLDHSGWIHDFNPQYPLQRSLSQSSLEIPLAALRTLASQFGFIEIYFDRCFHLISFKLEQYRFNIYYKTGSVIMIWTHPNGGNLFRIQQKQSLDDIRKLFLTPESIHFNLSSPVDEEISEEVALRSHITRLKEEQASLERQISILTSSIESFEKIRAGERKRSTLYPDALSIQSHQEQLVSSTPILQNNLSMKFSLNTLPKGEKNLDSVERLRGGNVRCNVPDYHAEFITQNWSSKVRTVALGGDGIVLLYDDFSWSCTGGLPPLLQKALATRPTHLPPPTYVSCGSMDRCFILFCDGTAEWNGPEIFCKSLNTHTHLTPSRVAFGRHWNSFVIVFDNGDVHFNNIPSDLERQLRKKEKLDLAEIYLGPSGEWFFAREDGSTSWMAKSCESATKDLDSRITDVIFGSFGTYIVRYR